MTMEAEAGVMRPLAQELQGLPEPAEARKGLGRICPLAISEKMVLLTRRPPELGGSGFLLSETTQGVVTSNSSPKALT